ncbi:MAG TPA: hypothetical protein VM509_13590 [Planctomycetota bacterium]|nr:hypothetical protein [Planctomycetota bacterium]
MFEDIEADGIELDLATASDREVLHAIFTRGEIGDLDAVDCWAELAERYPDDLRFSFLAAFEQWSCAQLPPMDAVLRQVARLSSEKRLREPLVDLLSLVRESRREELAGEPGRAFERVAEAFDGARRDAGEAEARLRKVARGVLGECHDRTLGNRPLAPKRKPTEMRTEDWPAMSERARNEPEAPYSTATRFKVGAKVKHPTLGIGFVVERREGKIDVLFQSGKKTLVGK